jgi:hypothetical protein
MSTKKHLEKIAEILWMTHEDEIRESGDWYWNLKNWTFNFVFDPDWESITAYKAKDGNTLWSEYITISARKKEWEILV